VFNWIYVKVVGVFVRIFVRRFNGRALAMRAAREFTRWSAA
jgi:hypothetical protein